MKKFNIKTLATLSMFTAVSVILARFLGFYLTESTRVSFEYFVIVLAGMCFGPLAGAVVGGLSDLIGATLLSAFGFYPPMIVGPGRSFRRTSFRLCVQGQSESLVEISCYSRRFGNHRKSAVGQLCPVTFAGTSLPHCSRPENAY